MHDMSIDALALLTQHRPLFHGATDSERSRSWGISPEVLRWLQDHVRADMHTLETGSGDSTVIFVSRAKSHIAVAPDDAEHQAIRTFCQAHGIPTDALDFKCGLSQAILPTLESGPLDVVLIDGDHAFPAPFIDWYYVADRVRCGGYVLVDDTQLRTGRVLRQFLLQEPEWQLLCDLGKTAVFKKLIDGPLTNKWWGQQPWGAIPWPEHGAPAKSWLNHLHNTLRLRTRLRAAPGHYRAWSIRRSYH